MSTDTCPVVKIKPSHESQGDFVEINESDFDPQKHERYEESAPKKKGKKKDGDASDEPGE